MFFGSIDAVPIGCQSVPIVDLMNLNENITRLSTWVCIRYVKAVSLLQPISISGHIGGRHMVLNHQGCERLATGDLPDELGALENDLNICQHYEHTLTRYQSV